MCVWIQRDYFFLFKQYFISRKWIGQQAYKPIINGLNEIICEAGLKPNSDTYTQLQHHQRRTV